MAFKQQDPVAAFFENSLTLEYCKQNLIEISDGYMSASAQHDREWEEEKVRESWAKSIREATSPSQLISLIT